MPSFSFYYVYLIIILHTGAHALFRFYTFKIKRSYFDFIIKVGREPSDGIAADVRIGAEAVRSWKVRAIAAVTATPTSSIVGVVRLLGPLIAISS